MAETKNPVIELTTASTRRNVSIDGELYEIINLDEMSLSERMRSERFVKAWTRAAEAEDEPNSAKMAQLVEKIDGVIARILVAPDAVRAKLQDGHKLALLNTVFTRPVRPAL
jgi:hypothetical protein